MKAKMLIVGASLVFSLATIGCMGVQSFVPFSGTVYAESKVCQKPTDKDCVPQSTDPALAGKQDTCRTGDCIIDRYVSPLIKALSALVGVAATASIVYAGIQYSSSGGDSGKTSAAKKRIAQTIGGLLAWLFLLAFLNWLMPGGLF